MPSKATLFAPSFFVRGPSRIVCYLGITLLIVAVETT